MQHQNSSPMHDGNKSAGAMVGEEYLLNKVNNRKVNRRWFLYLSAIIANLLIFSLSTLFSWSSSAIEKLISNSSEINPLGEPITAVEESWLASLLCLGAAIGPLLSGTLSDKLGRKRILLLLAVPNIVSLSVICYARNITIIFICRFINGLAIGSSYAVMPTYLSEIAEVQNRGAIATLFGIFMNLGVLFSYLVGPLCSFRLLTFLCGLPSIIFLILFGIFIPESPVFLISAKKENEAKAALKKLRMTNDIGDEFKELLETYEASKQQSNRSFLEVFKDIGSRKALIITVGLMLNNQFSGINAFVSYLDTIFKASGSTIPLYFLTNAVGIIQVIGNCISASLVEKLGRKFLILLSAVGILIVEIGLAGYFFFRDVQHYNLDIISWLPVVCTIGYIFAVSLGVSPLPFTIMGEIFPTSTKAAGSALGCFSCFMSSFVVTFVFRIFMNLYGMAFCFTVTSCSVVCGIFFIYIFLPETKGKSETEIQQMLVR